MELMGLMRLMTELRESSSQRNYILVLKKDGGSSCSVGNRRVDAFTSKDKQAKKQQTITPSTLPHHLLLSFFQKL